MDFQLTDFPSVNKKEIMTHFDDWITDFSITFEKVCSELNDAFGGRVQTNYSDTEGRRRSGKR